MLSQITNFLVLFSETKKSV